MRGPLLSVIIPAHGREDLLKEALRALEESDLPRERWELIVVDDGSCDECVTVAARFADTVVRLPGAARGPAYARNRGVDVARGELLVFLDADVAVHGDTLRRLVEVLESDSTVAGVFGSADDAPPASGLVSKYWNLLRAYGCRRFPGEAWTFDASCGAIRRSSFLAVNGFDEWHFQAPEIEDLELGLRLREREHRLVLCDDIQVKHLKRWSFTSMIRHAWRRGMMLGRLLDYAQSVGRARSDVLHTLASARSITGCMLSLAVFVAADITGLGWEAAAGLALIATMVVNFDVHCFLLRRGGALFTLAAAPIHLAAQFISGTALLSGWLLRHVVGEPTPDPTIQAFAEVGVKTWPPIPMKNG